MKRKGIERKTKKWWNKHSHQFVDTMLDQITFDHPLLEDENKLNHVLVDVHHLVMHKNQYSSNVHRLDHSTMDNYIQSERFFMNFSSRRSNYHQCTWWPFLWWNPTMIKWTTNDGGLSSTSISKTKESCFVNDRFRYLRWEIVLRRQELCFLDVWDHDTMMVIENKILWFD